jgi:hypothetical protein
MNEDKSKAITNQSKPLDITSSSKPDVPVFACLIYIRDIDNGRVAARVANFAGIELEANTERDALARLSREFKKRVTELSITGEAIPLLDPPLDKDPSERVRSIPVHL